MRENLDRKLKTLADLTERLARRGVRPVLVGGTAVELFTGGAYSTADVDLVVVPREAAVEALKEMDFAPCGRHFVSKKTDVVVEIPSEELAGSRDRVSEIGLADGRVVYCIGLEDLIIDRLNAAVHWKSEEDERWAAELIRANAPQLDWNYLRDRARGNGLAERLERLAPPTL